MIKVIKEKFKVIKENVYEKHKSLFRFAVVGCINTGVDFFAFTLLHSVFGIDKLLCQVAGYSLGIVNSFIMNKLWTFEDKQSKFSTSVQLVKFIAVNAVSLGISLLGLKVLNESLNINVYVAKVIVTGLAQIVNYFGYKLWVFHK